MTYRILDLFCGAGGAAKGYANAGFEVAGVDLRPQPHYPYGFCPGDVEVTLLYLLDGGVMPIFRNGRVDEMASLDTFDAIHASPPCQAYSVLRGSHMDRDYPDLVAPTRELLNETGLPYVIENVEGAPLLDPATLCGSMFPDTEIEWKGKTYGLQRHRLFETNWPLDKPALCAQHRTRTFPVYGHGYPGNMPWFTGSPMTGMAKQVMHIHWMNRDELSQAIPPYFTEYVGTQLLEHLMSTSNREAA